MLMVGGTGDFCVTAHAAAVRAAREQEQRREAIAVFAVERRAHYLDRLRSRSGALGTTPEGIKETVIQEIRNVLAQFG
jgi:hypothetical protein